MAWAQSGDPGTLPALRPVYPSAQVSADQAGRPLHGGLAERDPGKRAVSRTPSRRRRTAGVPPQRPAIEGVSSRSLRHPQAGTLEGGTHADVLLRADTRHHLLSGVAPCLHEGRRNTFVSNALGQRITCRPVSRG